MNFLIDDFRESLTPIVKDNDVHISSVSFSADKILETMDSTAFQEAFNDWLGDRKQEMLSKADEILNKFNNQVSFSQLKTAHKVRNIIPFIGAGLSIPSGYKGWTEFLRSYKSSLDDKQYQTLENHLSQYLYEEAAEYLSDAIHPDRFNHLLEGEFDKRNEIQGSVRFLPVVFSNYLFITTNFDNVLKRVFDEAGCSFHEVVLGSSPDAIRQINSANNSLILLHGKASSPHDRVLTTREYEAAYGNAQAQHTVLDAAAHKSLLFLGCSLHTDRTVKALQQIKISRSVPTKHYAFLAIEDEEEMRNRNSQLIGSNIFPIYYPANEDHDECLEALFRKLME